jgi:Ser-tRNA(Ala) deacylase AlaX
MRDAGDDEAQMLDIDYVEMLEYGMPPACGLGFSERVFWMFEGVSAREGVIFPQLRMEVDETTKKIYPEVNFEQKKKGSTEVPESADKHGTYKIYLNDWGTTSFEAKVESSNKTDDGFCVVLDQTAFYPGGGGQACDLGTIDFGGGKLVLTKVHKDENGVVYHEGVLEGEEPKEGQEAKGGVDAPRRLLNSRLHCAGHMIDYAVRNLNKSWKPGKGAHYPGMSFVEYDVKEEVEDKEKLARDIEELLNGYIKAGGEVSVEIISSQDVVDKKISDYIPQAALESYKAVHVVNYPGQFKICCGGTHVKNVSDVGKVKITKIKKKDGNLRISYEL